jgi:hypothetical protein
METSSMPRNSYFHTSDYEPDPLEWLVEPRSCVDQFLDAEEFDGEVLDPCCGGGTIVAACLARGIPARGSDLVDRGFGEVCDFKSITEPVENIVSNFPYSRAEEFARHALGLARRKVALILRVNFWCSQRRNAFFREFPPIRFYPCSDRPSMPPGKQTGEYDRFGALVQPPSSGGTADYGWFVFKRGFRGDTVVKLLRLRDENKNRLASASIEEHDRSRRVALSPAGTTAASPRRAGGAMRR